ncbi:uncharacterized protein K460DRAFT_301643 [Cucurbitaria berberidis CBS 394.84]|uniref:DNA-directed RNA polymerase subunit n=1 Tax=Cucurbitaria berberidis CBS 394.84 TaxID=1168544 RepID=A0A9P4GRP2_9PLEO|nr:uncharacterized protein K460DRAFT_301643 [Cucurbitaria berberidis CBS 394.84]KAF1850515.1 hypothetical protein K460DRAFT_301643 [Cucurbitaria berberidis CBS 394.84]
MSLVGSLLFCTTCGSLLDREPSTTKLISCQLCGESNKNSWPISIQTTSKPDAFPSSLQQKRSEIQTINEDDVQTWGETPQACPSCSNPVMLFTNLQLRGADEGTTVFYRCPKCNHSSKMDN